MIKTFKQFREDMGGGISAPGPTNAVSSGAIAGTGEKGGEPGVNLKKKRAVIIQPMSHRAPPKM
jgi:hypothetical protein